ncbi:EF hand [Dictyocaulus viviparus]|uniref:EF hand n=1 Tax=Dictyocaulus viviparus TaxID=29172 RepID=A0A0D8XZM8_DICVI|nr:EF hand [Dictyocaulus viviparus]
MNDIAVSERKLSNERINKSLHSVQKQSYSQDSGEELTAMLKRRAMILNGESVPEMISKKLSLYAEFSEFTRKQIKFFTDTFNKYDDDADGFIDFDELKRMMEKLGEAQTHITLKEIIRKVDEDQDGKISLREFLLIFRLAAQDQLRCSEVFQKLASSIDVSKEGVLGAANFFQAKIEEQTKLSRFEQEIKEEHEERKRFEEDKKARREKFLQHKSIFQ